MTVRPLSAEEDERLRAARFRASRTYPYLAGALVAMQPVGAPGLGTFAVDPAWRVYLDPELLMERRLGWVAAVLVHECMHLVRRHSARAVKMIGDRPSARARVLWNLACDLAINDDIPASDNPREFDVSLEDGVRCRHFGLQRHLLEEVYFMELLKRDDEVVVDTSRLCGRESGLDGMTVALGAAADVAADEFDLDAANSGRNPFRGLSAAAAAHTAREAEARMRAEAERAQGDAPGRSPRVASHNADALVNWRAELRRRVRRAVATTVGWDEQTWTRRPRRPQIGTFLQPASVGRAPIVAVIVDTSGSVSARELNQAFGEIRSVLNANRRGQTRLYAADAAVREFRIASGQERTSVFGGGGTDMVHAIGVARAARPRADLVIVLTDGWTRWPAPHEASRLLAVITPRGKMPPDHIHAMRLPPLAA